MTFGAVGLGVAGDRRGMGELITHSRFSGPCHAVEPWLTKQQLAAHLKMSTRTIDRMTLEGLPYTQLGKRRRYKAAEVEQWLVKRA